MNWSWRGNTTGVATSPVQGLPNVIESFSVVNKTTGSIGVNVYLFKTDTPSTQIAVAPNTVQLATGEMYEGTRPIVLLATEQIKVHVSGNADYDFTLNNLV